MKLSEKKLRKVIRNVIKEELEKGEIHQLEGKTVDYSVILNTGTIRIVFKDGTYFSTKMDRDTKIRNT